MLRRPPMPVSPPSRARSTSTTAQTACTTMRTSRNAPYARRLSPRIPVEQRTNRTSRQCKSSKRSRRRSDDGYRPSKAINQHRCPKETTEEIKKKDTVFEALVAEGHNAELVEKTKSHIPKLQKQRTRHPLSWDRALLDARMSALEQRERKCPEIVEGSDQTTGRQASRGGRGTNPGREGHRRRSGSKTESNVLILCEHGSSTKGRKEGLQLK